MDYAAFHVESYEHLMGTPQKAHEGSQSAAPEKDPGGVTETKMGAGKKGKSLPEKSGVGNLDYVDE